MLFNDLPAIIVFLLLFIWIAVDSFFLYKMKRHYDSLTKNASGESLTKILDKLIESQSYIDKTQSQLVSQIETLQSESQCYIQRLGIERFNPFSDTGGSQSFTLALLDGNNNGIVMTSLYARSGNRWYIKYVKNGRGVGLELSHEEQTAISKAKPLSAS